MESEKEPWGGICVIRDAFPVLLPLLFQVFHEQMVASSSKELLLETSCVSLCSHREKGVHGAGILQMLLECSTPGHWDGSGLFQLVQTPPTAQREALPDAPQEVFSSLSGHGDENFQFSVHDEYFEVACYVRTQDSNLSRRTPCPSCCYI